MLTLQYFTNKIIGAASIPFLLLVLTLTACAQFGFGQDQKVKIEPGKTDACQLLTRGDAEKVLGQKIEFAVSPNPVMRKNIRIVQCNYAAQAMSQSLAITLYQGLPADTRAVIQAIRDRNATTSEMSEVSGLADELCGVVERDCL